MDNAKMTHFEKSALEVVSLDDMDWFEFEHFTAHLFQKLGFGKPEEIQERYPEAFENYLNLSTVISKNLKKKTETLEEENAELKKRVKHLESKTDKISDVEDRMKKLEGLLLDMGKAVSEMRNGN